MDTQPTKILLVEDNTEDANLLAAILEQTHTFYFTLDRAQELSEAFPVLDKKEFDIILLDLALPDSRGLETFAKFHSHTSKYPIIVLTGLNDENIALQAVKAGAQDYLVKWDFNHDLIVRAIRYSIERHHLQEMLREQSVRDPLTGLYNRRGFLNFAQQQWAIAQRSGKDLSIYFIDLDGLKDINDTFKYEEGDRAIFNVAEILRRSFRAGDVISRFGGDEFAVLTIDDVSENENVVFDRLTEQLKLHNAKKLHSYELSFSTGRQRLQPSQNTTIERILDEAEQIMHAQKVRKRLKQKAE